MLLINPTQLCSPRPHCLARVAYKRPELLQYLSGSRQELGRTGAWSNSLLPPSSFLSLPLFLLRSIFFSQTLQAASAQQYLDCLQRVLLHFFLFFPIVNTAQGLANLFYESTK